MREEAFTDKDLAHFYVATLYRSGRFIPQSLRSTSLGATRNSLRRSK